MGFIEREVEVLSEMCLNDAHKERIVVVFWAKCIPSFDGLQG